MPKWIPKWTKNEAKSMPGDTRVDLFQFFMDFGRFRKIVVFDVVRGRQKINKNRALARQGVEKVPTTGALGYHRSGGRALLAPRARVLRIKELKNRNHNVS